MRVLIADDFSRKHLEALEALGLEVQYSPGLKAADLATAARDASVLIVRSTEVTADVFRQAKAL